MLFTKRKIQVSPAENSNFAKRENYNYYGQSMIEYMVVIGMVTVVMMTLGPLFKRGIQSVVRLVSDQLQTQANAEQKVTATSGYMIDQYSSSNAENRKWRTEDSGVILYNYIDQERVLSNSAANLGFTNRSN